MTDLNDIESFSELPATRAPDVLSILIEVDPLDVDEKDYPERVEKFARNYFWRMLTGDITVEFLEATVDRMFNSDEVTTVVNLEKLKDLKRRVVNLFLPT